MNEKYSLYLIWSIEHTAWWAPHRRGYVRDPREAGQYSQGEAIEIVKSANLHDTFNECMIPVSYVLPEETVNG
jgi:hypothetical protein